MYKFIYLFFFNTYSTALHKAALFSHLDIVAYLVEERGAYMEKNNEGETPLDFAKEESNVYSYLFDKN